MQNILNKIKILKKLSRTKPTFFNFFFLIATDIVKTYISVTELQ